MKCTNAIAASHTSEYQKPKGSKPVADQHDIAFQPIIFRQHITL